MTVRVCELIGAFADTFAGGELALFYRCELQFGRPRPADIVDALAWFPIVAAPEMAFESEDKAVRALQERLRESPFQLARIADWCAQRQESTNGYELSH